jgi:hypothetical protein
MLAIWEPMTRLFTTFASAAHQYCTPAMAAVMSQWGRVTASRCHRGSRPSSISTIVIASSAGSIIADGFVSSANARKTSDPP